MAKKIHSDKGNNDTKAKEQFNEDKTDQGLQKEGKTKRIKKKLTPENHGEQGKAKQNDETRDSEGANQEEGQEKGDGAEQDGAEQDGEQELDQDFPEREGEQNFEEGQEFMLAEQREWGKNSPKYQFCKFISKHYRLIEDKKQRKHHFVRLQPVFVRFTHVLKLLKMQLIDIDTFRKYFKKFFKMRNVRYQETTNRVDMKVVVGIDRRYNSKFDF